MTARKRIPVALTIGLVLLLSVVAQLLLRFQERDRIRSEFANDATEHAGLIEARLRSDLLSVRSLAALCGQEGGVSRARFAEFVRQLQPACPTIQAWEWAPRVNAVSRHAVEADARREGFRSFSFRERAADGTLVPAAARQEYFPVLHVEPLTGNEMAAGYDLGSDAVRREAIMAATDNGAVTATARIKLVQGESGLLVFAPVYRSGAAVETAEARRKHLVGFALGVVKVGTLVAEALTPLKSRGITVRMLDRSARAGSDTLCEWRGGQLTESRRPVRSLDPEFHHPYPLQMAGRDWVIACEATPEYIRARQTWQPMLVFAIGVIITLFIAVTLIGTAGRAERCECLVDQRTRELSRVNDDLVREVAERKRAETVLVRRERETRTLLDALPGYVFFKDVSSTYLGANEQFRRAVGCYPEPIEGKTDFDLLPRDLAERYRENDRQVMEENRLVVIEEEPFMEGDRRVVVSTRKVPLTDEAGRVIGLLGLGFDISSHKRTEQTLQDERDLFADGPVVVFKWKPTGGWPVEYVSENVLLQWGYPVAEVAGVPYVSLVHPEDVERMSEEMEEYLHRGDHCFEQEYRIRHQDGQYRWVYDFTVVTRDAARQVTGLRGYVLDISDRRELEEVLRDSREQLHLVLEATDDGLWDWNVDTGEVQYSQRWASMLGYHLEEIQPCVAFWEQHIHPDDKTATTEALNAHLCGLTPGYECEYRMRTQSGEWIWILDRGKVVKRAPDGRPLRAAGTHTDVTARRYAQHALMMLRLAVEQSVDGIAVADMEGRIQFVNRSFSLMHGYGYHELSGCSLESLVAGPAGANGLDPLLQRTRQTGSWSGETQHQRADGTQFAAWVTNTLTRDSSGREVGMIMTVRDITTPKQAEAAIRQDNAAIRESLRRERVMMMQLEAAMHELRAATEQAQAADHAKSEFLANMSHEIRSPLTAIIGYAHMLSRGTLSTGEHGDCCRRVEVSARHLLGLVNDVLDLSKIEAGQMRMQAQVARLPDLLEEVCAVLRPGAEAKGLGFCVTWGERVPEIIDTDPVRFKQILVNLVGNAIKFTEQGGVAVAVRAEPLAGGESMKLAIKVSDTGIGIPADRLGEVFAPFVQVHDRGVRNYGGTGLGLAISRRLARLLGGDLQVVSRLGQGSEFTFFCEVRTEVGVAWTEPGDAELRAVPDPAVLSVDGLRGKRLLIVDDAPDNQRIISFLLDEAGATAAVADNGERGVEAVLREQAAGRPYDLVLMDMQMPVMDGYAATARLRELGVGTPIVALTAYAMSGDEPRCLSAGCNAYLSKPIDPSRFQEVLVRQLAGAPPRDDRVAEQPTPPAAPRPRNRGPVRCVSERLNNPKFLAVLKEYCEGLPATIAELQDAWERKALDDLKVSVHRVAGTGGMYGYPDLSEAGRQCERAILDHQPVERIGETLAELLEIMGNISIPDGVPGPVGESSEVSKP